LFQFEAMNIKADHTMPLPGHERGKPAVPTTHFKDLHLSLRSPELFHGSSRRSAARQPFSCMDGTAAAHRQIPYDLVVQ
jgi:hypothetical protein